MIYRFKDCELDPSRFELRRAGQTVPVEPQVLELLNYLVVHRERAVTRTELFDTLWRGRVVSESALNSRIKEARAAIGDDGKAQAQIRTLHRTGYRFVGEVEEVPATVAAAAPLAGESIAVAVAARAAPRALPSARRVAWRRLGLVGVAASLGLAVGAFALLPRGAGPSAPAAVPAKPALAQGRRTLTVLPFTNLSGDEDQDYFADGVGVELLIVLSRVPDLLVTGRVSSSYFKGRNDPLPAIGDTLGVDYLLAGSVRRAGDRVRVTAELVDAASGYQLWSDKYELPLGDILDLQDEIAERVATALEVKLGLGDSAELGMTRDVAAYDEFLRGVWQFTEFRPETIPLAIEHMNRAIALDPSFARAWAYLYCIYSDGSAIVPERAAEWRRKMLEVLERARRLTPDSPFVDILLAREEMRSGKPLAVRTAVDRLPSGYWTSDRYVTPDVFRGKFALGTGHTQEAVEALERAKAADPFSPVVAWLQSVAHANTGDSASALAAVDRGLTLGGLEPRFVGHAVLVALGTGDRDEIERRVAALPHDALGHRAFNVALAQHLDDPVAGVAEIHRLAAGSPGASQINSIPLAHWAAYYGDTELALEILNGMAQSAVDEVALWRPVLGEVRRLSGFKDLVRREGLVDYWRQYGWPDLCQPTTNDDFECR
jgi:TolB-like protein/DNA-binding winged helix-turn-helix (wHTH) protein